MKLIFEFNDKADSKIKRTSVAKAVEETLARAECGNLKNKNVTVSVAVVSEEEIRHLNMAYRKKNSATDILSFSEFSSKQEIDAAGDKDIFLGELVLCYNKIKEYALEDGKDASFELSKTVAHGMLHLLGFSHGRKMFAIQNEVARNIN